MSRKVSWTNTELGQVSQKKTYTCKRHWTFAQSTVNSPQFDSNQFNSIQCIYTNLCTSLKTKRHKRKVMKVFTRLKLLCNLQRTNYLQARLNQSSYRHFFSQISNRTFQLCAHAVLKKCSASFTLRPSLLHIESPYLFRYLSLEPNKLVNCPHSVYLAVRK